GVRPPAAREPALRTPVEGDRGSGHRYARPVMSAVSTTPRERTRRTGGSGLGAAWRVIVLNDTPNTVAGVAFARAQTFPGVAYDRGMALATRIHPRGQAVVWSGHQEAAELYPSQLEGYGLTLAPLER